MAQRVRNAPAGRGSSRVSLAVGLAAAILGVSLMAVVTVFVVLRLRSGSDAARFNHTVNGAELPGWLGETAPTPTGASFTPPAGDVERFASLYPGDRINPKYWDAPQWAGSAPFGGPGMPEGFEPVSASDVAAAPGSGSPAVRIRIPAIGLDSRVEELELLDLGDQAQYETPNGIVGHIPETANPGQASNGWYFGHLQSIVQGQGSVFRKLPEIADLIRQDPVDVYLTTADGAEYLYRVTGTAQVSQEDLIVSHTSDAQVTLVTCWPPGIYDQRILVHTELVAHKASSMAGNAG